MCFLESFVPFRIFSSADLEVFWFIIVSLQLMNIYESSIYSFAVYFGCNTGELRMIWDFHKMGSNYQGPCFELLKKWPERKRNHIKLICKRFMLMRVKDS